MDWAPFGEGASDEVAATGTDAAEAVRASVAVTARSSLVERVVVVGCSAGLAAMETEMSVGLIVGAGTAWDGDIDACGATEAGEVATTGTSAPATGRGGLQAAGAEADRDGVGAKAETDTGGGAGEVAD